MPNISSTNSKEMIREALFNYMKENSITVDWTSIKLTQLSDNHLCKSSCNDLSPIGFIAIYSDVLWFLIENGFNC
jgi:hypothetical protein